MIAALATRPTHASRIALSSLASAVALTKLRPSAIASRPVRFSLYQERSSSRVGFGAGSLPPHAEMPSVEMHAIAADLRQRPSPLSTRNLRQSALGTNLLTTRIVCRGWKGSFLRSHGHGDRSRTSRGHASQCLRKPSPSASPRTRAVARSSRRTIRLAPELRRRRRARRDQSLAGQHPRSRGRSPGQRAGSIRPDGWRLGTSPSGPPRASADEPYEIAPLHTR